MKKSAVLTFQKLPSKVTLISDSTTISYIHGKMLSFLFSREVVEKRNT